MKKTLKMIAAALAAVTAISCSAVTASADRLETRGGVTYRYTDTGRYLGRFTGWTKTRGKMYYYLDGVRVTKNMVINGRRFKFDKNGVYLGKYTGWTTAEDGNKHYWKNGEMLKSTWIKMKNGRLRYVAADGAMRTGWSLAVRGGKGKFSFFDKNGCWDGKTYYSGYEPKTLADVFKDIDFFSGEEFFFGVGHINSRNAEPFYGSKALENILARDLNSPLLWDSSRSGIGDLVLDSDYTAIVIRSSVSDDLELRIYDGGAGSAVYLYCPYYGFGLRLSDKYAFSKLAKEIGLGEWDHTQTTGEDEVRVEYEDLEPLDEEEEQEIIADFLKYKSKNSFWRNVKPSDLRIYSYLGSYRNGEAVIVYGDELECTDDCLEMEIAGYTIELGSGSFELLLHCSGTFVPIADAYERDLLTDEDIGAIAYYSSH